MHAHHEGRLLQPLALELRHLRLVLAVHEQGGLTRAGERLHLSQSALSHQLQEIEARLGVQLFRRVRRRLVLSEAGERLLDCSRRVLGEVVALEDEIRVSAAEGQGRLRLTTECYTVYDWLPSVLRRFARRYPSVEVQVVAEATSRAVDAVVAGEVDLALVTRAPAGGIHVQALFEDELCLVTAPGHRLAGRSHVKPRDLDPETLVLYSPPASSGFYQQFLAGSGHTPRKVMQVGLTEAMLSMIKAGLGIGVFARWAVRGELSRGTLAAVRLGTRGLPREWKAVTRAREKRPAWLDHFVELLVADGAADRLGQGTRLSRAG
jgi:LysR family transcriptional regulator for metE and metH